MTTTGAMPKIYEMYREGRWLQAESAATFDVVNPATEETIAVVPNAHRDDMKRAIAAAKRAFDEGPWPRMSRQERYRIIRQIADGLAKRRDELAHLHVTSLGTPVSRSLSQMDNPIQLMYECAEWALTLDFEEMLTPSQRQTPTGPGLTQALVLRQPVGVCGLIPTWNGPLTISVRKIGPALATGCTMVVKPSPWNPLFDLELAKIIDESDLPKGVFNVVTGEGQDIGEELVESPMIDLISFTGGIPTGKRIMEACAGALKRVVLELGGKSANIILDDVDVDAIASSVAAPACNNSGQVCSALSRVLVPERLHDNLIQAMSRSLEGVKIGSPESPDVTMGPLIREQRRQAVEGYIRAGVEEGASLASGGKRPERLEKGYFLEPTVFAGVSNDMTIAREEIFGPVLSVIPVKDVEEAIRVANDSVYGLAGNVITNNVARGLEVARRVRAGAVSINGVSDLVRAPRGGFKESGIGRECGKWSLYDYTEIQSISWPA